MPIPASGIVLTVNRATKTYIKGRGAVMTPVATSGTRPNLSAQAGTPPSIFTLGIDSQTVKFTLPSISASGTYTYNFQIGLPNISLYPVQGGQSRYPQVASTQGKGMFSKSNDIIVMTAVAQLTRPTPAGGVVVSSCSATGQATTKTSTFQGPFLSPGQAYQSFAAVGSVVFSSTGAYAGGEVVTLNVTAHLILQPR